MPLLICPNDNSPMQSVRRDGVEFDICPSCRGVWLDRGELETLMGEGRRREEEDRGRFERDVDSFRRDPGDWSRRHPYDAEQKRYRYDDDDDYRYGRKKRSIFDLFD